MLRTLACLLALALFPGCDVLTYDPPAPPTSEPGAPVPIRGLAITTDTLAFRRAPSGYPYRALEYAADLGGRSLHEAELYADTVLVGLVRDPSGFEEGQGAVGLPPYGLEEGLTTFRLVVTVPSGTGSVVGEFGGIIGERELVRAEVTREVYVSNDEPPFPARPTPPSDQPTPR